PKPPPPAEGRVNSSPAPQGTFENTAPRNVRSPSRVSQTPWGIDGKPPSMPQVIDLARSHMYDITVASASLRIAPFSTPQPPRNRPGPAESVRISCPVVSTGQSRSCASSGWTARPTPKIGAVAFEPSLPLRPPQPPTIQSYHMKIGRLSRRASRPPTSRYSRLNEQARARSGWSFDQSSKIEFMLFS